MAAKKSMRPASRATNRFGDVANRLAGGGGGGRLKANPKKSPTVPKKSPTIPKKSPTIKISEGTARAMGDIKRGEVIGTYASQKEAEIAKYLVKKGL